MTEKNENANSTNGENDEVVIEEINDDDDVTVLKEKYQNLSEANKKLYARTKKAEGFELKDGKWIKPPKETKPETRIETKPNSEPKSGELDSGSKALLVAYGIKGKDELALAQAYMTRTGDDIDTLIEDDIFQAKLSKLRETKASQLATPSGTKRSTTSTKDSVDFHLEKYESGAMKLSEMPFEMREKVLEKTLEKKANADKFIF